MNNQPRNTRFFIALSCPCSHLEAVEKPFDKLRVNGGGLRKVEDFPFVLSLSKYEYAG
jgi:hypothetical protein